MLAHCLLVPAGCPLSMVPALTLAQATSLLADLRDQPVAMRRAAGRVIGQVREGVAFLWTLPSLGDAGAIVIAGHRDARFPDPGRPLDVVIANVTQPGLVDRRFIAPGPGTIAGKTPRLLPPRARARALGAVYRHPQHLVLRPADTDEIARLSASAFTSLVGLSGPRPGFGQRLSDDEARRLDALMLTYV